MPLWWDSKQQGELVTKLYQKAIFFCAFIALQKKNIDLMHDGILPIFKTKKMHFLCVLYCIIIRNRFVYTSVAQVQKD